MKGASLNVLVEVGGRGRAPVKVLRARPTRHFIYLLVRCRCGKTFGHRADRRAIVCYYCGRMADIRRIYRRPPPRPKPRPGKAAKTRVLSARPTPRRARSRKR